MPDYTSVARVYQVNPAVGSVTSITSASVITFITHAEALINSKLARLYTVPVAGSPPILDSIAVDLTLYRMLTRRMFSAESANDSPWPDRYKEAMELLDALADGSMTLVSSAGVTVEATPGASGLPYSNTMNYSPTFSEDDMENQRVSPDKIEDIQDVRD